MPSNSKGNQSEKFVLLVRKLKEDHKVPYNAAFRRAGVKVSRGRNIMYGNSSATAQDIQGLIDAYPELKDDDSPGELTKDYFDQRINEVMRMIEELRDAQIEMSEKAIQRAKETIKRYSR